MTKKKGLGNPLLLASAAGGLDPTTKKVLLFGGIGLVALVGYVIYRKIILTKTDIEVDKMNDEIMQISVNYKNTSITDEQAVSYARQILKAMDGMGTNSKAVYSILDKLKTRDDYNLVYKSFGAIPYGMTGKSDSWIAKKIYADGEDMLGWFAREFSSSEAKKELNPRLAKFGVSI